MIDGAGHGVNIADSSAVVIANNTIVDAASHGVLGDTVHDFTVDGNWISGVGSTEDGSSDGIALVGCTSGDVRGNAVRAGKQRYGLSIDEACQGLTTSANLLNGAAAPYHCESASAHDQVELYAPSGARFALSITDAGDLTTRALE